MSGFSRLVGNKILIALGVRCWQNSLEIIKNRLIPPVDVFGHIGIYWLRVGLIATVVLFCFLLKPNAFDVAAFCISLVLDPKCFEAWCFLIFPSAGFDFM